MKTDNDAFAVWKSIFRNHPFFNQGGGMFGWDWPTFRMLYPRSAAILKQAIHNSNQSRWR